MGRYQGLPQSHRFAGAPVMMHHNLRHDTEGNLLSRSGMQVQTGWGVKSFQGFITGPLFL